MNRIKHGEHRGLVKIIVKANQYYNVACFAIASVNKIETIICEIDFKKLAYIKNFYWDSYCCTKPLGNRKMPLWGGGGCVEKCHLKNNEYNL